MVQGVIERHGGLDFLINNAGVNRDTLALRMSDDDWRRVIEVNLDRRVQLRPRRPQAHGAPAGGEDREHRQRRRLPGKRGAGELLGVEVRSDRHDPEHRAWKSARGASPPT